MCGKNKYWLMKRFDFVYVSGTGDQYQVLDKHDIHRNAYRIVATYEFKEIPQTHIIFEMMKIITQSHNIDFGIYDREVQQYLK